MKLEVDLLRDLLMYVEEKADRPISHLTEIILKDWEEQTVAYHVMLAAEAGLIIAHISEIPDEYEPIFLNIRYSVARLTFNGHQFLESIRDPKYWSFIKTTSKNVGNITIGMIGSIAQSYAKAELAKQFGFNIP
ncbi:DUF2513 domain-containing protein [Paenochrobactrum sp. BZR 588]|uniref:DUF2513 domain-containing protein n=1 Tax=unclassified Paenochrobactrum TaxID=2639760 RepID=UPI0038544AE5